MLRSLWKPSLALAGILAATACSGSDAATTESTTWHNTTVHAVSRMAVASGVVATTSMKPDGTLETVAVGLKDGRKLWNHPATMAGRLPGMGVTTPAVVETAPGKAVVVALDPAKKGRWNATLVARDAHTGAQKWTRPVHSTFGPQRCGPYVCLSEHTALAKARMVVLEPATGKVLWRLPGISEVEWSDRTRVLLLRLSANPSVESYELKTGKLQWQQPIEQALGPGIDMSGGWAFGSSGDDLVGYVAPYTNPQTRKVSTFGLFSVKLSDGTINWMRPSVVRVYPSGNPGHAPVVRPVDPQGAYGGFARLDPQTGRVVGQIPASDVPGSGWWLAFPERMDKLGFLTHNAKGTAFDLATGDPTPVDEQHGWSFCVTDPKPLPLRGQPPGFYSTAAVCEYDLATGKRVSPAGAPPLWFTGSEEGWRLWHDEKGALHAVHDHTGSAPGMYG
ncbi:Outer membrane protein assembly factor BamB, contains PQQ-like beta-propeller repeat [Nonomuraea maritima]|uniref:Outer membrane protein assembly factor BamB, contains PQQ-like beta-propeller repeat n=1 Tax=Nonomuraea maritima TaxID=683260 RepID=A0A1G8UGK0_9ACTN|nr:PQQ-binding-like beta-propeller repeat protein [Nonomuraea maritima]SDJ52966.1 Outer membrane protein assembly factor BamB, contains PQQ-like beta-propeller repeat [Nonomuraea maritima]